MTLLNLGIGIVMAFAMRETAQESGIPQNFSAWNSDVYDSDLQRISWKVGD